MWTLPRLLGLSAIAVGLLGTGCNASSEEAERGGVRFIQLSPDAGPVNVLVDGFPTDMADVDFQEGTNAVQLVLGGYSIGVVQTGKTKIVLGVDVDVAAGSLQTVVAYDLLQSIKGMALEEDDSQVPAGKVRIRVIHVAASVGHVDVYDVTKPATPVQLYDDLTFGTAGDSLELVEGKRDLGFDLDGDQNIDLTFAVGDLPSGDVLNVFFVSDDQGDEFLILQSAQNVTSRIDPE